MNRGIWTALWADPLKTLGGAVMLVAGVAFSQTGPWWQVLGGNFLVLFGGVLVTEGATAAYEESRTLAQVRQRLKSVGTHIATTCTQMQAAAVNFENGIYDSETFAALIKESHRDLYAVQDDLQNIAGERFEAEEMLVTVEQLRDFSDRFEGIAAQAGSGSVDTDELAELRSKLDQIVSSVSSASTTAVKLPVQVACPDCCQLNEVMLGTVSGSSAMPTCLCGSRFHVHRDARGGVFTKQWGASASLMAPVRHVGVVCPNCKKNYVSISVPEGEDDPQTKWCLDCYARLVIDPVGERVIEAVPEGPLEGAVIGEVAGKSIVQCSSCSGQSRAFARRGALVYAQCFNERRLVRAPAELAPVNPVLASRLVGWDGAQGSTVEPSTENEE